MIIMINKKMTVIPIVIRSLGTVKGLEELEIRI